MAQRADNIRHDIEHTRAAMTEQLAILEERVQETVAGAQASVEKIMEDVGGIVQDVGSIVQDVKATVDTTLAAVRQGVAGTQAAVEEIVEHVKDTIGNTVTTVQHTFDLPTQVEHHPWPMVGGALLAGYVLGSLGGGRTSAGGSVRDTPTFAAGPMAERAAEASRPGSPPATRLSSARPQPQPGLVSGIVEQLRDTMKDDLVILQSVAVGAVMSTLRGLLKQALPALAPHLEHAQTRPGGQLRESPGPQPAAPSSAAVNGVQS